MLKAALLAGVRALGGRPELLASGALAVTIPPMASAQDQATLAARVALFLREQWPHASVAVTTGRGAAKGGTVVGELADHAARLIHRRRGAGTSSSPESGSGVWLDTLTARLLGARFSVAM